jgi:DNA-nicking Smr family endonuclease
VKRILIEDSLDLHSFLPRDVSSVIEEYLAEAKAGGLQEIRLIHGKGKGVRRAEIRRMLAAREDVEEFFDASPDRGGFGATIVRLK